MSMMVPSFLLKKLYKKGSLRNAPEGLEFTIENSLSTVHLTKLEKLTVDGTEYEVDKVDVLIEGEVKAGSEFTPEQPLTFTKGACFTVRIRELQLDPAATHMVVLQAASRSMGLLKVEIGDHVATN